MKSSEFMTEQQVGKSASVIQNARRSTTKKKINDIDIEEQLNEFNWKKTLTTGLMAASMVGASGVPSTASATPFSHHQSIDQMTGEKTGGVSTVISDSKNAILILQYGGHEQQLVGIRIPKAIINFGVNGVNGRAKLGDAPVFNVHFDQSTDGSYDLALIPDSHLASKIANFSGELKIEVPIFQQGSKVFRFSIESDQTSKKISNDILKRDKAQKQASSRRADYERASSGYLSRIIARIKPNLPQGNGTSIAEITTSQDGTIVSSKIVSSSGSSLRDQQVLAAIEKTASLPRDIDGKVPPKIIVPFYGSGPMQTSK